MPIQPSPIEPPQLRLVSLVPSTTEILAALGLSSWLVARTHECDHPASILHAPAITTPRFSQDLTAQQIDQQMRHLASTSPDAHAPASASLLDEPTLRALRPDMIFTQALCGVCALDGPAIVHLASTLPSQPRVVVSSPQSIEGIFDSILQIAEAIDHELSARSPSPSNLIAQRALDLCTRLRGRMYELADYANPYASIATVALIEWLDPLYIAGHWAPQLVERAGGLHPLNPTVPVANAGGAAGPIGQTQRHAGKSIRVPADILLASQPDVLIIAPCGRTLDQALADTRAISNQPWFASLRCVQQGRVAIVDGTTTFSRPGPRIVDAYAFLVGYLNDRPELVPPDLAWSRWPLQSK
jgi:iron complex transport system substrate-binding protein